MLMRMKKSSSDSPSLNLRTSNSRRSVPALALRTHSTPTYMVLITSHAIFAIALVAMEPIISAGTTLAITSSAMRSLV